MSVQTASNAFTHVTPLHSLHASAWRASTCLQSCGPVSKTAGVLGGGVCAVLQSLVAAEAAQALRSDPATALAPAHTDENCSSLHGARFPTSVPTEQALVRFCSRVCVCSM